MEIKNPFALKDNRVITIYDLGEENRGLKCNCVCPLCKAPFEAKMGDIRQWHFAHSGTPCDSTKLIVNSTYLFVSQIIQDYGRITYPSYIRGSDTYFESGEFQVESVTIKYTKDDLAVGIIINDETLAIRLNLSIDYCAGEIKKPLGGLSTMLIDFKDIEGKNTSQLVSRICEDLLCKSWVYSRAVERENLAKYSTKEIDTIKKQETLRIEKPKQKEYIEPTVFCKMCRRTVHKEDALWGKNTRQYICHECIEKRNLDWSIL